MSGAGNINRLVQQSDAYLQSRGLRNLLALHFSISSAGLIVFSMAFAGLLGRVIHLPGHLYTSLFEWARTEAGNGKSTPLLQYILTVGALFAYYPLWLRFSRVVQKKAELFDKNKFPGISFYFLALIAVNAGLLLVNKDRAALVNLLSVSWIFLFLWFPLSLLRNRWLKVSMPKWFIAIMLCLVLINYAAIFIPLVTKPMMIGSDYLNIPVSTILGSGKVVDNIEYINKHDLLGMQLHDPRSENNSADKSGTATDKLMVPQPSGAITLTKSYSDEEMDFIDRNKVEPENREKRGWFLYHHGYSFGPMYALSLGAPANKLTMVYGWLSTVVQTHILQSLGMVNYQGYFKEFFSIYLLYFAMFLGGIWLIFRRLDAVFFAGILALSAMLDLGLELIKLAPGFNPVRHFFDVPAFYLLYRYLVSDRKIFLYCAIGLGLFAILWNKDFGVFLALSIAGVVIFMAVRQHPIQKIPLVAGGVTTLISLLLFVTPMAGANPTAIYMLMGVGSPKIPNVDMFHILLWIGILLLLTIRIKQTAPYKVLTIGMAFYFVQSLTYYIWYPKVHHLLGIAPIFIFWMVALYHGWITSIQDDGRIARRQLLVFVPLLLIYLAAYATYQKELRNYDRIFKSHQLYQWPFKNASFISTMNPALFEEAASMLKQYSPNSKAVYIISKYDDILPMLANKYSSMPYNELLTNLVSGKEVDAAANAILTNKPTVLYVDSDIGHNLDLNSPVERSNDVVHLYDLFGSAAIREGDILSGLDKVYMKITPEYKKCASGRLISVYCRQSELSK
jgi:hypothetical protein